MRAMSDPDVAVYEVACVDCTHGREAMVRSFASPEERERWAREHVRSTGHDPWYVEDEQPST